MTGDPKLCQIIAVVGGVQARANETFNDVRKTLSKPALFEGLYHEHQPYDAENGRKLENKRVRVQCNAEEELRRVAGALGPWLDAALTRDVGNTHAFADIVVGGQVLARQVPVPTLLFLQGEILGHMRGLLEKCPLRDPGETWLLDEGTGNFRTETRETPTIITEKVPLVLYPATEKHPAQVQVQDKSTYDGVWRKTSFSGAMSAQRVRELLSRLGALRDAIKDAVQIANQTTVTQQKLGDDLFTWLLQ
jgi:hypothetical protein